jgi:hypothetical protein
MDREHQWLTTKAAAQSVGAEGRWRRLATVRRHGVCGSPEKRKEALCGCFGRAGLVRASLRDARQCCGTGDAVTLAEGGSTAAAASGGAMAAAETEGRRKTEDDSAELCRGGNRLEDVQRGRPGHAEAAAGDRGTPGSRSKVIGDGGRWRPAVGD